ncbi:MAG TPA: sodium-dependent transporter, partial [Balneolales bacterium]|nr:sodium-dependent transporter [Balneolales bacterium]
RNGRKGTIGSFIALVGDKFAWMGTFVGFVATAIMFYYAVVTGWCIYYFVISATQPLPANVHQATVIWQGFQGSAWPVICLAVATIFGGIIVAKGISSIEKVNKVLIPVLALILIISLIKALTLSNSTKGLQYLFTPDWSMLSKPRIWLEALTQNAWDTGAGWGLILTYAAYMKKKEAVTISAFQTGIGNNLVSLTAAIIIFSTVFGTLSTTMSDPQILQIMKTSGPASTGLTFMWLPQLFLKMPAGRIFATLFFLALTFAAFSSLISMIELATKILVDMGVKRIKATVTICSVGFLLGLPSALDLSFFENQDFVWGIGLMISGALIAFIIIKYNVFTFRTDLINTSPKDWTLGRWWDIIIKYIVPIEVVVLLTWWIYQSAAVFAPHTWFNPFDTYSVATCFMQWGIAAVIFILFNKKLADLTNFDWSAKSFTK